MKWNRILFVALCGMIFTLDASAVLAQETFVSSVEYGFLQDVTSVLGPTYLFQSGATSQAWGSAGAVFSNISQALNEVQQGTSKVQKDVQDYLGLGLHGMFAATYLYNFDRPVTGDNLYYVYDYFGANSIEPYAGEIYLERQSSSTAPGFVLDLNTANLAFFEWGSETVYWQRPGPTGGCPGSPCDWLDPTRVYLTYTLPVGNGITITAGNQYSLIGYETIPNWQNINLFQSIGYVFQFVPFTVDGIRATYDFNPKVRLILGVNNGWNALASQNPLQTFEGQLVLKPLSSLTYTLSGMYGTLEADSGARSGIIDNVLTLALGDKATLAAEYYFAHQDAGAFLPVPIIASPDHGFNPLLAYFPVGILPHGVHWMAGGVWFAYNLTSALQFGVRGEALNDPSGFVTGLPQNLWEITVGFNYKFSEQLVGRFEFRHNQSSAYPFPSSKPLISFRCPGLSTCITSAETLSTMDTVMLSLVYLF